MVDIFSKEKRSEIMSNIRSKDTGIEKLIFRELRKKGICFKKNYRKVLGCPDVALVKKKKSVFIDGDFWHGYRFQTFKKRLPRPWKEKIEKNITRDKKNRTILKKNGWKVLRIWEHEIQKNPGKAIGKIVKFLK